ncbi:MAG: hypothetical protein CM15mP32_2800 [Flavobacteriaceae bacterium]|nr:MAG: hypothetical protein CM15mP32_2800 [Flavobacteriaceae bacterium]
MINLNLDWNKKLGLIHLNHENNKVRFFEHDIVNAQSLRSNEINVITKDNSGLLWIGTARGGVSKLDLQKKRIEHIKNHVIDPFSLSGNIVNSIYEDSQKNIWIGTFGNGLNVFADQPNDNKVTHIDSRLLVVTMFMQFAKIIMAIFGWGQCQTGLPKLSFLMEKL